MTALIELLPGSPENEAAQVWIIGTRAQVVHLMNECFVKKIALDRVHFSPIVPAPFSPGKYMCVLTRSVNLETEG